MSSNEPTERNPLLEDPEELSTADDTHARYRFFPTVRRGFPPSTVFDPDTLTESYDNSSPDQRPLIETAGDLQVHYTVEGRDDENSGEKTDTKSIEMYGPGHITGIDRRQIIRIDPEPGTSDFLPNYFPVVEFDTPDLPWLFSPVSADRQGRGFPWCCLVVVKQSEETQVSNDGTRPLPSFKVSVDELPRLDEAWAWAHAQVVGSPSQKPDPKDPTEESEKTLAETFTSQSDLTCSRLIAPRNLRENTSYIAAVVPTFEAGRQAGLGRDQLVSGGGGGTNDEAGMTLAWGAKDGTVELPVFHHWEFSTGSTGDFEFLARKLEPRNLNDPMLDIGFREVDVTDPGPATLFTDTLGTRTARVGGALRQADSTVGDYARADELRQLLNMEYEVETLPEGYEAVGPPIYGRWYAQRHRFESTTPDRDDQQWLYDLNLHPGYRLAAATGGDLVRDQQESLMASAWEQVGSIREANRLLAAASLSRETMRPTIEQVSQYSDERFLQFTGPMHDRLRLHNGQTVGTHLSDSSLPRALLSAAFRRLTSSSGLLSQRLEESIDVAGIIQGVIAGELDYATPDGIPDGAVNPLEDQSIADICEIVRATAPEEERSPDVPDEVNNVRSQLFEMIDHCLTIQNVIGDIGKDGSEVSEEDWNRISGEWRKLTEMFDLFDHTWYDLLIKHATDPLAYVSTELSREVGEKLYDDLKAAGQEPERSPSGRYTREDLWRASRGMLATLNAIAEIQRYLGAPGSDQNYLTSLVCESQFTEPEPQQPNVPAIREAFDPISALEERIQSRLGGIDLQSRVDPFDSIMAYPEFPQPMFRELAAASEDYLLPGVAEIPNNTFGILETNPEFIESFMLGLNHEMASELLWRRYPTDRRGSYFRQFWDSAARIPKPDDLDNLKDITEIHSWDDKGPDRTGSSPLGSNIMTGAGATEEESGVEIDEPNSTIVVVIRGELLRRYPNTTIYAAKAKMAQMKGSDEGEARVPEWPDADKKASKIDSDQHRFPIFQGSLSPDITFLGFTISAEQAVGDELMPSVNGEAAEDDLGWFFVLEEAPGEPTFGIDEATTTEALPPPGMTYTDSSGRTETRIVDDADAHPQYGWNALSWGHLPTDGTPDDITYVSINKDRPGLGEKPWRTQEGSEWTTEDVLHKRLTADEAATWGENSAHMAYVTWQKPVRIAIHADDLLPSDPAGPGGSDE